MMCECELWEFNQITCLCGRRLKVIMTKFTAENTGREMIMGLQLTLHQVKVYDMWLYFCRCVCMSVHVYVHVRVFLSGIFVLHQTGYPSSSL